MRRWSNRWAATSLSALLLAGCAPTPSPSAGTSPDPATPATCDAAPAQSFVGHKAESVVEQARAAAGARTVRVIAPGQPVTMDYRPDRLNIETDATGTIVAARCG